MVKTLLKICLTALLLAATTVNLSTPTIAADTPAPTDPGARQIRVFYDTLLDSMKNANRLGIMGRYKKLAPAIDITFDFPAMTKMIVGPDWETMTGTDKQLLISAFRRMTIADYARNFDGYNGEAFTVDPDVQERANNKIVRTEMTVRAKAPIPFVYRLARDKNGWRIVDIYLNGYVSEVATRRADFASTLKSGGASTLAQKLNAITDNILSSAK